MKVLRMFCVLIVSVALAFASDRVPTKQLGGPASEFQEMGAVDLAKVGIRSKSALLPVHLNQVGKRFEWYGDVAVDQGDLFALMVFSGMDPSWNVQLRAPGARNFEAITDLFTDYKQAPYGMGDDSFSGDHFTFDHIQEGVWKMKVSATDPINRDGFILYGSNGPHRLYAYHTTPDLLVGHTISFQAYGLNADTEAMEQNLIAKATMRVTDPLGNQEMINMFDDGFHEDGFPGDGIYGAQFQASEVGDYQVQVLARGISAEGKPFLRTSEHILPVIVPDLIVNGDVAMTEVVDQNRLKVSLDVDTFEGGHDKFRVFAELWGKDDLGNDLAISWIGGMTYASNGSLDLGLDARWIGLADATGPFELRNLRIEDPDYQVAMARVPVLKLQVNDLPSGASAKVKTIDEEMLMGPRPASLNTANKAGHTLMVVHGYCSGDVWGGNMGNFASATKFSDFNQNRSHDAFALKIRDAGASFSGFGVVAHSQGGCAALHLYTYYWSGLDTTNSGSRKIQSVGTPYQGTALAGNLAVLGQVFGAGCGENTDLTYSGASSWLAGIPTSSRAKVWYYTTSFEDVWYRYDYCHIATDVFLSDPEDGTTEKSKGQLSGANNMGHKTKQCHTNSMRDPGQCKDSSRNATMSSNAER